MTRDLLVEREGRIVTLTVNRPQDDNRLTVEALRELERVAGELAQDTEVQVVIVTGAGPRFFSRGILDLTLRAAATKDEIVALVRLGNRAFNALEALPQIVIGALNGVTRAGGAELALACDMRLAASHATLDYPEATWGGFPGGGAPARLATTIGRARALELICTGRQIDAAEMERVGLVLSVHPPGSLMAAARALAGRIAAAGPLAVRGAKRIVSTRLEPGLAAARELSDALRHALEWSHDVDEGMAAHREGRPPRFTGR